MDAAKTSAQQQVDALAAQVDRAKQQLSAQVTAKLQALPDPSASVAPVLDPIETQHQSQLDAIRASAQ